jgi:hypothetical protein
MQSLKGCQHIIEKPELKKPVNKTGKSQCETVKDVKMLIKIKDKDKKKSDDERRKARIKKELFILV